MYFWAIFYGILASAVLFIAWRSGHVLVQKAAAVLFSAWAVSNFVVSFLGFEYSPYILPVLDTVWALYCCVLCLNKKPLWLIEVIVLFCASIGAHVAYHVDITIYKSVNAYTYFASLNVLFLLQLIVVGAEGAKHVTLPWVRHISDLFDRLFSRNNKGNS
jgi:hypothetical protein